MLEENWLLTKQVFQNPVVYCSVERQMTLKMLKNM